MEDSIQTSKMIKVDGADIYVQEHGSGEPLLLLHGMAGSGGDWQHVFDLDMLAQSFQVILRSGKRSWRKQSGSSASDKVADAHRRRAIAYVSVAGEPNLNCGTAR
jgi:pimeloyl-ACP methyl ester carboxylesterase